MQYNVLIQDAQGNPVVGAKVGIVPHNDAGYSLEDTGWWGTTDPNGYVDIYFSGSLTGYVVNVWSDALHTYATYFPAADYAGKLLTLDTAPKKFNWLLLIFGAIGFYFLANKKRK